VSTASQTVSMCQNFDNEILPIGLELLHPWDHGVLKIGPKSVHVGDDDVISGVEGGWVRTPKCAEI
jgi:hypothetical protein